MGFFKTFFTSCLGALVALIVFCLLMVIIISSMSAEEQVTITESSVLHLKIEGQINELQKEGSLAGLLPGMAGENIGLMQLKDAIKHAKTDGNIEGIYLEVNQAMTFYSTLAEIRDALKDFKESGKWVIAYNETMTEGGYYLSSVADKVYLNPQGDLEFNGLTAQFTSFRKLLDKLEVNPQVFRVGEFKSAVEPFLLEKMSEENRLQLQEMISSIYNVMLTQISASRNIEQARLKEISDKMLVRNAEDALKLGLVDSLLYSDEFESILKQRMDIGQDKKLPIIQYNKYRNSYTDYSDARNEIAVIVAEGTITPGEDEQVSGVITAGTFIKEIRKARDNESVKAIVLRINSPGGEFRSSDMMWHEVEMAAKVKPVIASMGDFAASGGYYIAMACDTIVAQPSTVTGSIGIFGIMFDMSKFLDDKIGVTFDEVKTGEFGEMYTVTRPLNDAEKTFWQNNLNQYYETFLNKAHEGRGVPVEDIRKVAGGRVWTGIQAQERRLVDVVGGHDEAVKIAAEKAGVANDYKVRYYPRMKSFYEQLLNQVEENSKAKAMKAELGEYYVWYKQWNNLKSYQGAQARLPFEFDVQ